jgi:hypothetical protein
MAYRYHVATVNIPRSHHLATRLPHKMARLLEYKYVSATDTFICTCLIEEEVPDEPATRPASPVPPHVQASKA